MAQLAADTTSHSEFFPKKVPVLYFPVCESGGYKVGRRWGIFDTLGVRGIDDLSFEDTVSERVVVAFTDPPPHAATTRIVQVPAQVAFERIFFHIQGISKLVLNPRTVVAGRPKQQAGIDVSVPEDLFAQRVVVRADIPEIVGAYSKPRKKSPNVLARAERSLRDNALFEALYLSRHARLSGVVDLNRAWFIELMAMSFMGLPDETLELYEQSPLRGSQEPEAQLLAGRLRLLLKQLNEGRSILHTLTFNEEIGAMATCEMARSYISSSEFDRALDIVESAIQKDSSYHEAYLVRGLAHRGLALAGGGEEELKEALKDFEKVSHHGGFNAPEALFHAGTVFGRLGALEQAEVALRQSLFQRDRYVSRDALIRVVCAAGKLSVAQDELGLLRELVPGGVTDLEREIQSHAALKKQSQIADAQDKAGASSLATAAQEASASLAQWKIPVRHSTADFALLDDFINRYAPAGEFMAGGDYEHLRELDIVSVERALSLHLASILVKSGVASWGDGKSGKVAIVSSNGTKIPIEAFVHERLLLGASGDNFTSLESLVTEILVGKGDPFAKGAQEPSWWREAQADEVRGFESDAEWVKGKLCALGAELHDSLSDLDEIDRVVELTFEPGGVLQERGQLVIAEDVDRFVVGVGLLVGMLVSRSLPSTWFSHELPEGISLVAHGLGRVFPVARVHRRIYLASAADTPSKLGSFAFGVAAAVISDRIRSGVYHDRAHVVAAFKELLPRVGELSDAELGGVVDALLERSRVS